MAKNNRLAISEFDRSKKIKDLGSILEFIDLVKKEPLKKETIMRIGRRFRFTSEQYALLLGVSVNTYLRKQPSDRISIGASEVAFHLADVYKNGMDCFDGDENEFRRWMNSEIPLLNSRKPIDLVVTVTGAEIIGDMLARMTYSIPS